MTSRGSQSNNPSGSKFIGGSQHRRTGSKNWSHVNVSSAPNSSASTFAANGRKANSAAQVSTTQGNQPAYHLANSAQDQEASLRHMNDRLLFGLIRSIGCKSRITTSSGATYDGILYTTGDITNSGVGLILKYPQLKKGSFTPSEEVNNKAELQETLIFSEKDILKMEFEDVDFEPIQQPGKPRLNTSGRSFRTDIDISANSAFHERELQKWVPDEDTDARLTEGLEDVDSNVHWDQFEVNERKFGIQSTYDEDLYTTKISKDAPDYEQRLKEAEKIAREIESQGHNGNIHLAEERGIIVDDSGVDEEDKYSRVAREPVSQNEGDALLLGMLKANTKVHKTELRSAATGKYVPPRNRGANFHGDPAIVTSSATEHKKDSTFESSVGLDSHDHGSSDHQTQASHSERLRNTTTESRKLNHKNEINSLREFSATFKVPSKIPPDLLPILSKDKEKQNEIMKKSGTKDSETVQKSEREEEEEEEEEEEKAQVEIAAAPDSKAEESQPSPKKSDKLQSLQTVSSDRLVVAPRNDWFNEKLPDVKGNALSPKEIEELYDNAKRLYNKEQETYTEEFNKSSSQKRFLSQVLTGGTLNDKISALTLLIQESPLHNHKALETMFAMCEKKSRTAALQCIEALVDLFINGVIPADRKLRYFNKQPLRKNMSPKEMIVFYFEDYLKKKYFQFIGTLEKLLQDSIVHVRTKVVGYVFSLLSAKPEQEANLLRIGVNKLGDIDNKVASKTSYHILLLEQQHPAMKEIVVENIFDVLFRKNNDHHAIYYSTITINQTILTRKEDKLANKLMDAYFKLFEKLLLETDSTNTTKLKEADHQKDGRRKRNFKRGKKGGKSEKNEKSEQEALEERNSKMFAAILTGLNRAFPFSTLSASVFESHLDTLFRITHSSNFNTSVQALMLIHRITQKGEINKDRYYRTLYESLLDDRLVTSSKQNIYLNLLFQSLKEDTNKDRVMAFVKRICQVCLNWINIGPVVGMVYLLVEIEKEVPEIRNLVFNAPVEDGEQKKEYDSRKRDPQFSNAQDSSLWEMNVFSNHFHPTVSHYTEAFFANDTKDLQKPNLGLFTLSHFLDRFVYKKAKMKPTTHGQSIMQPLAGAHTGQLLVKTDVHGELPTNTEDWINKKASEIRPEDRFFYEYFSTRQEKALASKMDKELNRKMREDDDEESDIDEDSVWNALVKSNPEVEGPSEDELSDFEMSELSDEEELEEVEEEEEEEEDEEGLVKLRTVDDLEVDDDEEIEEEEDEPSTGKFSDSSDSDIGELMGESEDESEDEEEQEEEAESRKRPKQSTGQSKKLKSLPTFASADDYAQYLNSSEDEY